MDSLAYIRVRSAIAGVALSALWLGVVPASAQIISTSIPRAETGAQAAEKKFALHVMASPFSKWRYNEIVAADWAGESNIFNNADVGLFSGTPNSDFLLAGEVVFKLGKGFTVGGGGWYNKVGRVGYDFTVQTYNFDSDEPVVIDHLTGTLNGDLKLKEGHASFFYKDIGIQVGVVKTRSTLRDSKIVTSDLADNIGLPLDSIEANGADSSATDWDLYGVYKFAGQSSRPYGISVGAGFYNKKGDTETSQRSPDDQKVFSGFLTGTVDVYKGLGVDVSYWYVAKTKADLGFGTPVSSERATNRFTIGFSYTFSR
jgi:hypothetical protein